MREEICFVVIEIVTYLPEQLPYIVMRMREIYSNTVNECYKGCTYYQ